MKDGFPFKSSNGTLVSSAGNSPTSAVDHFVQQQQQNSVHHHPILNGGGGVGGGGGAAMMELAGSVTATTVRGAKSMDASGDGFLKFSKMSGYQELWTKVRGQTLDPWSAQLRRMHWMNQRAPPGRAYTPTQIEHIANVITHGIPMLPAMYAGLQLVWLSDTNTERIAAFIYGTALIMLFAVSTFFHSVHYCNRNRNLKDVLHRCDRAMIYIFIAGSYYPWLSLSPPAHPTILFVTKWMVWLLAGSGILYQQMYHERYKSLETCLYLVMGMGPSLVIILCGHEFSGMGELKVGGLLYVLGIAFFKADGKIPCAHAIWHMFVVVAAGVHYFAILKHLYS